MIVVAMMLMISAARTFSAYRAKVMTRPMMKTNCPIVAGNANVTNVPSQKPSVDESGAQPLVISPPLAKPMNRMNRPMPTPIARLSESGTAFMIASRAPMRTRTVISDAFEDDHAHRARQRRGPCRVSENATIALMPRPAARANG